MNDEIMAVDPRFVKIVLDQYPLSKGGIHGVFHWARVMENGMRLAPECGARLDVIEYFALLHDSRRLDDGLDEYHGPRAVQFAGVLRNPWIDLDEAGFVLLEQAMSRHTGGTCDEDVTVQVCLDADRLDLERVGIQPDPRWLCTPHARDPETIAWASARARNGYVAIEILERWGIDWKQIQSTYG
jgi:uncharacterized protein